MGRSQTNKLARKPLLKEHYENYVLCRSTQLVVFRKPTGKKDGSEKLVTVVWPTGFTQYPAAGGLEDQSYLTTRLFAACLRGEQAGCARLMAKP
jgi:hypothetical protein